MLSKFEGYFCERLDSRIQFSCYSGAVDIDAICMYVQLFQCPTGFYMSPCMHVVKVVRASVSCWVPLQQHDAICCADF